MRWWHTVRLWLRSLVRNSDVERELDAELQFHLDGLTDEFAASGIPRKDARKAALKAMGGLAQFAEQCRDVRGTGFIETTWQDLRFGARLLAKHWAFTVVTVTTLAVGIGFTTLAFSAGRALLFGHLPVADPDRLILGEALREGFDPGGTSLIEYGALRQERQAFESTAVSIDRSLRLLGRTEAEPVQTAAVSPGFFETLGTVPLLGRGFTAEESRPGGPGAVLLSYGFWQHHFAGNPNLMGERLRLDTGTYTVVGVLPRSFDYPDHTQAWIPLELDPETAPIALRATHAYIFVARLHPGVSREQAQGRTKLVAQQLEREFPQTERGWSYGLLTVRQWSIGDDEGRLTTAINVLLLGIAFLLLIGTVNVANLLLVRGVVRERELAIRVGLGASIGRVARQLFTEALVLSLLGAAAGFGLARALRPAFRWLNPIRSHAFGEIVNDVPLNGTALAFCVSISVLCGLVFASLPALKLARLRNPIELLRQRERRAAVGTIGRRALRALVISEIALGMALSFGGALLTKSFYRLDQLDLGFWPDHLLTAQIPLSGTDYPSQSEKTVFADRLLQRVRALPGVASAGATTTLPMQDFSPDTTFTAEGHAPPKPSEVPVAALRHVTPGYAETLGLTLVKGRFITADDRAGTVPVAVISEALARQAFGSGDPIGKRLRRGRERDTVYPWMVVIGIVRDVKEDRLNFRIARPVLYVPFAQRAIPPPRASLALVCRTTGEPSSMASGVRAAIHEVNPYQPIGEVSSMDVMLSELLSADRFSARLMALLAVVGLFLATIGLYTVIAYSVSQRTGEIGLRVALGAQRSSVLWMIVREGGSLMAAGLALAAPLMLGAARLLSNVLFLVRPTDPAILFGLAAVLTAVTATGCVVPAVRALRLDPVRALQHE